MKFTNKPFDYEQIYRPVYEIRIAIVWFICGILTFSDFGYFASLSYRMAVIQASVSFLMSLYFFWQALPIVKMQWRLYGAPFVFIPLKKFCADVQEILKKDEFYLGQGFTWGTEQTQRAFELKKLDWAKLTKSEKLYGIPKRLKNVKPNYQKHIKARMAVHKDKRILNCTIAILKTAFDFIKPLPRANEMGQRWIHGLSAKDEKITIPASWLNGHLLILGTTGSGKTRFADLMISQCIMRGDPVVIIDPKGDLEMRDNAKRACDAYREYCLEKGLPDPGDRFHFFHPAFPEESVRLNLLANSNRDTDITTRVTNLIPSQGGFDPFTAFGWLSINAITQALLYCGENPTINSIKMNLLDSMESLTDKVLDVFCERADEIEKEEKGALSHPPYATLLNKVISSMQKAPNQEAMTTIKCQIYSEYYEKAPDATNIAALVKLRNHPREHFSKMINNMLPLMDMLTVGTLGTMLSMSAGDDPDMKYEQINTMDILDRNGVLYIGLDSLSDKMVGQAIGSLALSDIAASAGAIYNYHPDKKPVAIFVDEAAECVNDPFIQILNKGRGAGFRLMVATQTISDFTTTLGSKDKAEMVLGNINNVLALRTKNPTSQKFLSEDLPMTVIKNLEHTQGINSLITNPLEHGSTQSEKLSEKEVPLIDPQLFGLLPNLEYIGIFAGGNIIKGKIPFIKSSYTPKKKNLGDKISDDNIELDIDKSGV